MWKYSLYNIGAFFFCWVYDFSDLEKRLLLFNFKPYFVWENFDICCQNDDQETCFSNISCAIKRYISSLSCIAIYTGHACTCVILYVEVTWTKLKWRKHELSIGREVEISTESIITILSRVIWMRWFRLGYDRKFQVMP